MSDDMFPEKPYEKSKRKVILRRIPLRKNQENSSPQVFIHIDENEKWAFIKVRNETKISENEKLEILKIIKNLINQFIDNKYNKIFIDFIMHLEANEKEIEYLINYNYNNLNDPMPENNLFHVPIYDYEYEDYKFINEKCIKIDKILGITYSCNFINDEGNQVCHIYDINGTTEITDCQE